MSQQETTPDWLLLTGLPGSGKTTVIRHALERTERRCGGFYTEELRQVGTRVGFSLKTTEGREAPLAHVAYSRGPRVGKYTVDENVMTDIAIPSIEAARKQGLLVVIDEIGKMELLSEDFRRLLDDLAGSRARVLGSIMYKPNNHADRFKQLPFVRLLEVRQDTRAQALQQVLAWLGEMPS